MASKQAYENNVFLGNTHPVRVLFRPKLDKPEKIDGRGDAKYEIQVGFEPDHPDYEALREATRKVAAEKWGDDFDIGEAIGKGEFEVKFVDGDEEYERIANHKDEKKRKEFPHLKGLVILKLRSKQPISVFDTRRRLPNGTPELITDPAQIVQTIYGGCYVALKLTFATYDKVGRDGKAGVTIYPEQVCFVADGERLGGGDKSDGSGFASVQGAVLPDNPEEGDDQPTAKKGW